MTSIGFIRAQTGPLSEEEAAALAFARKHFGIKNVRVITIPHGPAGRGSGRAEAILTRAPRVIWWHFDQSILIPPPASDPDWIAALCTHVQEGGSLFLSLLAAQYAVDLGLEKVRPNILAKTAWQENGWEASHADTRGLAGRGAHPVFKGLYGGPYTWSPQRGTPFAGAYYQSPVAPGEGHIVALEREYHRVNDDRILGVEYELGSGRVLTVGAHLNFAAKENPFRASLEKFAANCISYLDAPKERRSLKRFWPIRPAPITAFEHESEPAQAGLWHNLHRPSASRPSSDDQFDLGGRRLLMVGEEPSGIEEIWAYPLRIAHGLTIAFHGEGEIAPTGRLQCAIAVRSEFVTRIHELEDCVVEETIFADRKLPSGAIHFKRSGMRTTVLSLTAHIDLREMWPMSAQATGPLGYGWDAGLNALLVSAEGGVSILGANREPLSRQITPISGQRSEVVLELEYLLDNSLSDLTFVFAGSSSGGAESAYRSIMEDTSARLTLQVRHSESTLRDSTLIEGPDEEFNALYSGALLSTERFLAEVPGAGTSLMAGIAPSSRAWDEGQASGGRPGRAWFIGREAIWTALGLLEAGMFQETKEVLTFFGETQDDSGKILHEMTASGYVERDSADATPLYLLLMGRYVRASADSAFLRAQKERILRALAFCSSSDRDGDGLMENTSAGHGWVEEGKLSGAHVELYLASCWGAALFESAYLAGQLGLKALGARLGRQSKSLYRTIGKTFWNDDSGFFAFGIGADGSQIPHESAFASLPLIFGQAGKASAERCLDRLASWEFAADWGTRLTSTAGEDYNPAGRQEGSVWPLMSGWTALAEFAFDRPAQGYARCMSTMQLSSSWSAGNIPEGLHGERMELTGLCQHYASSGGSLLQALLAGMLGIKRNAPSHRLKLQPYFPPQWTHCEVHNIRVGNDRLSLSMRRRKNVTSFRFATDARRTLGLEFRPWFSLGTNIHGLSVNGKTRAMDLLIASPADLPEIDLKISGETVVDIHHAGGFGLVPPVPHPRPGESSLGIRLIRESWEGDMCEMVFEGKTGTEYALEICADTTHIRAEGAGIAEVKEGMLTLDVQFEEGESEYSTKVVRVGEGL